MRHRRFGLLLVAFVAALTTVNAQLQRPAAPLEAPSNLASEVSGRTVSLTWSPPASPVPGYVLEAALVAGGPAIATFPVGEPALVVGNVPDGVYFVRVRALDQSGAGPSSNEVIVVVGPPVCAGAPSQPSNLTHIVSGNLITMTWQASGGCPVTNYVLRAGSGPLQSDVLVTLLPAAPNALQAVAPPGRYFVRIAAVNAFGTSAESNEIQVDVANECVVPGIPANLSTGVSGSMVSLQWQAPAAGGPVTDYVLEAGSSSTTADIAVLPVGGVAFTTPAPPGSYFVRVRARNACGTGPASTTRQVVVACVAPGRPSTPAAGVFGSTATLSWAGVAGATAYRLEVGTASGGANVFGGNVSAASRQLSGLGPGTYFARVRAINGCGTGAPSGEAIFVVAAPPSSRTCGGSGVPSSVGCGVPTAQCNDGTFSCSQNRSGTCSSHRGVACWVCPGPLCG